MSGMKKDKAPTKKQLKLALMQQKAETARLLGHVQTMGPLMESMMIADFDVLKLARRMRRDLDLVVVMDQGNTDQVKIGLDLICERVVEFAAQWRSIIDPTWDPANMALPKSEISDLILDVDEDGDMPKDDRSCTSCDWSGLTVECVAETTDFKDFLCCPICLKITKEITEDTDAAKDS